MYLNESQILFGFNFDISIPIPIVVQNRTFLITVLCLPSLAIAKFIVVPSQIAMA